MDPTHLGIIFAIVSAVTGSSALGIWVSARLSRRTTQLGNEEQWLENLALSRQYILDEMQRLQTELIQTRQSLADAQQEIAELRAIVRAYRDRFGSIEEVIISGHS